jgi:flagellar hook-length control protein FliK
MRLKLAEGKSKSEMITSKSLNTLINTANKSGLNVEKMTITKESKSNLDSTIKDMHVNLDLTGKKSKNTHRVSTIETLNSKTIKTEITAKDSKFGIKIADSLDRTTISSGEVKKRVISENSIAIDTKPKINTTLKDLLSLNTAVAVNTTEESKVDKKSTIAKGVDKKELSLNSLLKSPKEAQLDEQMSSLPILSAIKSEKNIKSSATLSSLLSNGTSVKSETIEKKISKDITQIEDSIALKQNENINFEFKNKVVNVKETFNSFSSDLKEKLEDYKAPLMKIELNLKPKDLGSLDVTLITRGNSIQINLASNQQAMQLFSQNMTEFKEALANIGFENLSMNFNSNQNSDSNPNQQHQEGQKLYEYLSKLDDSEFSLEDELESLDIFVPNYA